MKLGRHAITSQQKICVAPGFRAGAAFASVKADCASLRKNFSRALANRIPYG
jgi:hypothetical protein